MQPEENSQPSQDELEADLEQRETQEPHEVASGAGSEGQMEAEPEVSRVVETRVVEAREVHTRVIERVGDSITASEVVHATTSDTHSQRSGVEGQEAPIQTQRERSVQVQGVHLEGRLDEEGHLKVEHLERRPATTEASLELSADPTTSPPATPLEAEQALAQPLQVLAGGLIPPLPPTIQASPAPDDGDGAARGQEAALRERVRELEVALDHRERQIRAMQETAQSLLSHNTVDAMVRTTLHLAIDVLEAEAGSLMLHNPATDTLVFRYVVGPAASSLIGFSMPATQGIAGGVFKSGVARITHKVGESQEHNRDIDEKTGFVTESMMTVALRRHEGASIGVMQILNSSTPFDDRDLEVIQVMAAQASASIDNARLVQEARKAEIVNVIGDISHDIKNMLTPIQSGVWTLEPMLDEMFRALDKIKAGSQDEALKARLKQAEDIVREDYGWILSAALEAAENVQLRTKEIADAVKGESAAPLFIEGQVNEVVEEVARALRLVALDARLDLNMELDPALPLAEFDRKQVYNALYNLVNNAIPETPPDGSITLRTVAPAKEDPDALTIQVADTGKGMPPHVKARLFTDDAVSTKPGGTGLGTRIVGNVVRTHNGKISVDSEPGQGTTFTIRLPLRHEEF